MSRDDELEGDSNSIVHQREILSEYARKHGFENIRFYADDGYSGTNFDRPDFQRMMADAQAGLATQLKKDKESEQLSIFDPRNPFTGSK